MQEASLQCDALMGDRTRCSRDGRFKAWDDPEIHLCQIHMMASREIPVECLQGGTWVKTDDLDGMRVWGF